MSNPILYKAQARQFVRRVFFSGSVALEQGQALCYDRDYGTAGNADENRDKVVELPSTSNNRHFAGVAARSYPAVSGGQWIDIYEPGSVCLVYTDQNVTLGDYLTARVDPVNASRNGVFGEKGLLGRGTVQALQTVDRSSTAGVVLAVLLDGEESGLVHSVYNSSLVGGALTTTVGGVTSIDQTGTLTSNITCTLADGDVEGLVKIFKTECDLGVSYDFVITVTHGIQVDDSTALASIAQDGDGDVSVLRWLYDKWCLLHNTGSTLSAS